MGINKYTQDDPMEAWQKRHEPDLCRIGVFAYWPVSELNDPVIMTLRRICLPLLTIANTFEHTKGLITTFWQHSPI